MVKTIKPTVTITPVVETPVADHTPLTATNERAGFMAYMHSLLDQALAEDQPSWKRILLAGVASLTAAFGIGYISGTLLVYAIVGAALLGVGAFVQYLILAVGFLIAMYAGSKASAFVYARVIDKSVDILYEQTTAKIKGWFTRTPKVATA